MRKITPPTVEPHEDDGQKFTHPSYGVVKVTRVSGQSALFDSAFEHQHFIALSICRAARYSKDGYDFIHEDTGVAGSHREIVEVWMSETQFARAITSVGAGSGSPCTIAHENGKQVPEPEREDAQKGHKDLVKRKLQGELDDLQKMASDLREKRNAKKRLTLAEMDAMIQTMELTAQQFASNMAFYAGCMEEHMEKTVASAKAEIEVHLSVQAQRLGINRDKVPQLEIQDDR